MIRFIKLELYKLIRNRYIIVCFLAAFVMSLLINIFSAKADNFFYQVQIAPYFFQIFSCLIIGSIWALEYSDTTIKNLVLSGDRFSLFTAKIIISLFSVLLLFTCYGLGLLLSNFSYFSNTNLIQQVYVIPFCLLVAQAFIMILFSLLLKSFSKLALAMIVFLCIYRLLAIPHENKFLQFLSKHSFSTIYYSTYDTTYFPTLINNTLTFMLFCVVVSLIISSLIFFKTDVI